jgi:toxin ParE1/3/4
MVEAFEVVFSAKAMEDLDQLFHFIRERASAEIADAYLARIERFCLSLRTFPNRGSLVGGARAGLRTVGFERRITLLFQVQQKRVIVLRILYGGRTLGSEESCIEEP